MINKILLYASSIVSLVVLACSTSLHESGSADSGVYNDKTLQNYATYCSGCHGKNLEAFRERTWKYGNSYSHISNSIVQGIENAGMPAYPNTFTAPELKDLINFIIQESKKPLPESIKKGNGIYTSTDVKIQLDTVTSEIQIPWGLDVLPDKSLLITDRDGDFYHQYASGKMVKISNTPQVLNEGQGGLMDVKVHPKYGENGWLYISYAKAVPDPAGGARPHATTAVIRAKLLNDALVQVQEVFEAKPYFPTRHHYGSRIVFDKKGYMFVSVGERGREHVNPQDLSSHCGKIHRLNDDGSVPNDNPYVGVAGVVPSVYSYGQRNPQGMDVHPITDEVWENEHGPMGGDEINIIKPKNNYGWPKTTYGINYNGNKISDSTTMIGVTPPIHYWVPSIAPSGAAFVTSANYGKWKGDYFVPSLKFNYLNRCVLQGNKVVSQEKLLQDIGRMRFVKQGSDGYLYVGIEKTEKSSHGYVFRLIPLW
jgi:aldose sugar dehydrogenase